MKHFIHSKGLKIRSVLFIVFILFGIFQHADAQSKKQAPKDEFSAPTDEFASPGDDFKTAGDDEFSSASGDEFQQKDSSGCAPSGCAGCPNATVCSGESTQELSAEEQLAQIRMTYLYWIIGILLLTLLAGLFVRFEKTRNFRGLFLLVSLFMLGFYNGGCVGCPVDGVQNLVLFFFVPHISWHFLVWFIGIVVLTYLFGKVWCGWICHWGALQEFLYLPGKVKFLQGEKVQKIFRISRYVLLATLITQLILMGTKYWCRIDPFVNIFSFKMFFDVAWLAEQYDVELVITIVFTLLILVTSVFSYRPFCRSMCPVGLILGWISYIPGASVVGLKGKCAGCKVCATSCRQDAIIREDKHSVLRNSECISCGDCITACNRDGLGFCRNNKDHKSTTLCKNECEIK